MPEPQRGERGLTFSDSGASSAKKRQTESRQDRRAVSVMDYFCGVASVCSSCGQWIMQKFRRMSICWSHSAFSVRLPAEEDFKLLCKEENKLATACFSLVEAHTSWQTCGDALHQPGEDKSTEAAVSRLRLGSSLVVAPFCSLCSSNPLLCPST